MKTIAESAVYPEQELTQKILKGALTAHNTLECGFLERVYSKALYVELKRMGLSASKRWRSKSSTETLL